MRNMVRAMLDGTLFASGVLLAACSASGTTPYEISPQVLIAGADGTVTVSGEELGRLAPSQTVEVDVTGLTSLREDDSVVDVDRERVVLVGPNGDRRSLDEVVTTMGIRERRDFALTSHEPVPREPREAVAPVLECQDTAICTCGFLFQRCLCLCSW